MALIITIIILIVLLVFTSWKKCKDFFTMERVKSTVDFVEYPVVSSYSDKEEASNIIGNINVFTLELIKKLKLQYLDTNNKSKNPKEWEKGNLITIALIKRFNSGSLQENEPESVDSTSYTTNKGEVISLCLREKESGNNKFHDDDILKFVFLHELAHIVTPELNHSALFWENFRFLLEFCKKYNLYSSPTYSKENMINYCGLDVNYTPAADSSITSYFQT
jgi:hypothetical protein